MHNLGPSRANFSDPCNRGYLMYMHNLQYSREKHTNALEAGIEGYVYNHVV